MYCYIYDEFVQDRKYERTLSAIENRITDLGLQGKIVRLALFRDPREAIRKEMEQGVKTVVVVGNDATVHQVVDAVVDAGATLALIPVGRPCVLASILGVPEGVEACDTLSQRIIEDLDVGRMNGRRFLTGVGFPKGKFHVRSGTEWELAPVRRGELEVRNLAVQEPRTAEEVANPVDGLLELVIHTTAPESSWRQKAQKSHLELPVFDVYYEQVVQAVADGVTIEGELFHIDLEPKALHVVVGRDRLFHRAAA